MLNPSTADAVGNNPTIRRCIAFTRRFSFARLAVVNLFAYRPTDPLDLQVAALAGVDVVGADNDGRIAAAAVAADRVVVAWGAPRTAALRRLVAQRVPQVLPLLPPGRVHQLSALGLTLAGYPRYPLMVPSETDLVDWPGSRAA